MYYIDKGEMRGKSFFWKELVSGKYIIKWNVFNILVLLKE